MIRVAFEALRQWTMPPSFRIDIISPDAGEQAIAAILSTPPPLPPPSPEGIPEKTAVDLCNQCFEIESKVSQMRTHNGESDKLDCIEAAIKSIKTRLSKHGIEYRNITGQLYDVGRLDFVSLGEAETRPGLKDKIIARIECPVVLMNSTMIQPAKGIVARPPINNKEHIERKQ
jgi:hypothetical protein